MSYIHLGADISVHSNDIIGIFDIEKTTAEKITKDYLKAAQKSGDIYYCVLEEMPKSFVITSEKVYISNVSAETLKKRCGKEQK